MLLVKWKMLRINSPIVSDRGVVAAVVLGLGHLLGLRLLELVQVGRDHVHCQARHHALTISLVWLILISIYNCPDCNFFGVFRLPTIAMHWQENDIHFHGF